MRRCKEMRAIEIARQTLARYLLEVELDGVPWRAV